MNRVLTINNEKFRKNQRQVNILANEAIHNILKHIDAESIQQKCTEDLTKESKLLGGESWRYIYYLGFWKKLIYLMDTHNSLKLCYSIKAFEDFKIVYLVNYRSELSNEEIKKMINDPSISWVGNNNSALVEYLSRKVAIEESIETLENINLHKNSECNINLNLSQKFNQEGDKEKSLKYLELAVESSSLSLFKILNNSSQNKDEFVKCDRFDIQYYNNPKFLTVLLPLYDIFVLFGRLVEGKLKPLMKELFNNITFKYHLSRLSSFILRLFNDPSKFLHILSPIEISVIMQGVFAPFNVRIPETSDITLNTLQRGYIHRNSTF